MPKANLTHLQVIAAPSNLGLSPLRPNHEPGTWRAPAALVAAGLLEAVNARTFNALPRPTYSPAAQPGTRLRNGHALRAFNLALADLVAQAHRQGDLPLVIGGDCSVLLGALAGARQAGPLSLIHIDGHSDFRHPGNYNPEQTLGAVAGMDLALATGRGEALATHWPGITAPLVADAHVVQLGERENRDEDFAWPDINHTAINRIDVFEALAIGPDAVVRRIGDVLDQAPGQGFWIHLDVDVLDQATMPAVDSPGTPGLAPDDLVKIMTPFVVDRRCHGMTVTVFDPDLDPDGRYAAMIVGILARLPFPSGPD
ncbi:arginase family protein [Pseudomonas entomophila]|uniref:Arginase family protein n=2 Tax=Pseudomonas entomophila TaxID=312306 RepID=A0ABY9QIH2_9PSED|nr:arginase family protein [Pseudomonas entomophila]WMW03836.1 arginase family protein [Pseudomonas entomophila]CAK15405.1 putative Arginase [Pseudomonas entomophila L48]